MGPTRPAWGGGGVSKTQHWWMGDPIQLSFEPSSIQATPRLLYSRNKEILLSETGPKLAFCYLPTQRGVHLGVPVTTAVLQLVRS